MAVALYFEKTDGMDYKFKSFNASTWYFYECWLVLHTHPKYLPSMPSNNEGEKIEDNYVADENGIPLEGPENGSYGPEDDALPADKALSLIHI